jgi:hypothetical protein
VIDGQGKLYAIFKFFHWAGLPPSFFNVLKKLEWQRKNIIDFNILMCYEKLHFTRTQNPKNLNFNEIKTHTECEMGGSNF